MEKMYKATQMLQYCTRYMLTAGTVFNRNLAHFKMIENALKDGEYALTAFTGLIGGYNHAIAITTTRIIIAKKGLLGSNIRSIYHKNINDISLRTGPLHGFIIVDSMKETLEFCVTVENAHDIYEEITEALEEVKSSQAST